MLKRVELYFDGNKTPAGVTCSYLIIDESNQKERTIKLSPETTVPQAEYQGLLEGLSSFESFDNLYLNIYGDSELVIKQIKGEWECKNPQLRILRSKVRDLLNKFPKWEIHWVPRKNNKVK